MKKNLTSLILTEQLKHCDIALFIKEKQTVIGNS